MTCIKELALGCRCARELLLCHPTCHRRQLMGCLWLLLGCPRSRGWSHTQHIEDGRGTAGEGWRSGKESCRREHAHFGTIKAHCIHDDVLKEQIKALFLKSQNGLAVLLIAQASRSTPKLWPTRVEAELGGGEGGSAQRDLGSCFPECLIKRSKRHLRLLTCFSTVKNKAFRSI